MNKSSTIGVDKVWCKASPNGIHLSDKIVSNLARVNDHHSGWRKGGNGQYVDGQFIQVDAVFNPKTANNGNLYLKVDLMNQSAKIQFNPSRFASQYGLTKDLAWSFERLLQVAKDGGIDIDIDSLTLTRLDVAMDGQLTENATNYVHHLNRHLSFQRGERKPEYPDGITMGNKSIQIGYYNRKKKVEKDKIQNDLHPNTGRNEVRLLTGGYRHWNATYFDSDVRNLMNASEDHLRFIYSDQCKKAINVNRYDHLTSECKDLHDKMIYYFTNYGQRWFSVMLSHDGVESLLSGYSINEVMDLVSCVDATKQPRKIKAYLKDIVSQIAQYERMKASFSKRESMSYVDEWLSVFVA